MRVFFYGLYMDSGLLESLGYAPRVVGAARLDGFQLMIGERATLVPAEGKSCYGFLIDLPKEECEALYARPEVQGYAPIPVTVTLLADSSIHQATCYVLQTDPTGKPNTAYAAKLAELVTRLGLPAEYSQEIESHGQ